MGSPFRQFASANTFPMKVTVTQTLVVTLDWGWGLLVVLVF